MDGKTKRHDTSRNNDHGERVMHSKYKRTHAMGMRVSINAENLSVVHGKKGVNLVFPDEGASWDRRSHPKAHSMP